MLRRVFSLSHQDLWAFHWIRHCLIPLLKSCSQQFDFQAQGPIGFTPLPTIPASAVWAPSSPLPHLVWDNLNYEIALWITPAPNVWDHLYPAPQAVWQNTDSCYAVWAHVHTYTSHHFPFDHHLHDDVSHHSHVLSYHPKRQSSNSGYERIIMHHWGLEARWVPSSQPPPVPDSIFHLYCIVWLLLVIILCLVSLYHASAPTPYDLIVLLKMSFHNTFTPLVPTTVSASSAI